MELTRKEFETQRSELRELRLALENKTRELEAVRDIGKAIRSGIGVEALGKTIVRIVARRLNGKSGSIMFLKKQTGELTIFASLGVARSKKDRYKLKMGEGLAGWCMAKKKPLLCHDMENHPLFKRTSRRSYRKREFLCVPFINKDVPIGVFNIEKPADQRPFTMEALDLLRVFTDETIASFENAFLFETLQRAYYETVKALAVAMEAKDPHMRGHGERVARYASKIAKALKIPAEEIKLIKFFSILHDIGKIGVPEHILSKPGKLTSKEWKYVKQHPVLGEGIIEPIEFLKPIRPLLRHHHEWYNGKGYPDRIKGGDIATAARILSVADAFDAMRSDRPYRKALSVKSALEEIKKARGTQFDPKIVNAMLRVFKAKESKSST